MVDTHIHTHTHKYTYIPHSIHLETFILTMLSTSSHLSSSTVSNLLGLKSSNRKDMEQILKKLEAGRELTKLDGKRKPEKRVFVVRRDTRQLMCFLPSSSTTTSSTSSTSSTWSRLQLEDDPIDLREVREVRYGLCPKIFEKSQEDAKKWESKQCFVILYGSSFRLKTLSCLGK